MEDLYKHWKVGTNIYLNLVEKAWEIGIQWMDGRCFFVKGWHDFALETEVEPGDVLVLYKDPSYASFSFNVCIFKGKDKEFDESIGNTNHFCYE